MTIRPPTATATASAPSAEMVVPRLEEMGYRLEWWRLSAGGAWMLRVFNDAGDFIAGSVQDDPADALLAVAETVLPPEV